MASTRGACAPQTNPHVIVAPTLLSVLSPDCYWQFQMKTLGIIGGVGPESTIQYYRTIIALYREQKNDGSYPQLIINSIDLTRGMDLLAANDLAGEAAYLLDEIQKLARAGADFGLIAANTSHIVFDELSAKSPIPLISIVEVSCRARKNTD
jgi:aspartate racemase